MPSKSNSASSTPTAATGSKLPVKIFRVGRIKAAVWENETDQQKFYNVTRHDAHIFNAQHNAPSSTAM
jgi:hypothetical protein